MPRSRKVRTGCRTCKARKVKCDESKPACKRCENAHFRCGGYGIFLQEFRPHAAATQSEAQVIQLRPQGNPRIRAALTSAFPSNLVGKEQHDFHFYLSNVIKDIEFGPSIKFWSRVVPVISSQEPAVFHSMLALTAAHQSQLRSTSASHRSSTGHLVTLQKHYALAISHLRTLAASNIAQHIVVLVTCTILIACDLMQDRYGNALLHLNNGRKVLQDFRARKYTVTDISVLPLSAVIASEEDQIYAIMASLDAQSVNFGSSEAVFRLVCGESQGIGDLSIPSSFHSIEEAWVYLLTAVNDMSHSINLQSTKSTARITVTTQQQGKCLSTLAAWEAAFKASPFRIPKSSKLATDITFARRTATLEIQLATTKIAAATITSYDDEMIYDAMQPQFADIIRATEKLVHLLPTISLDTGIVSSLFLLCSRCRNPVLRRRALAVLSYAGREGFWNASFVKLVSEQKMLFEEAQAGYIHDPARNNFTTSDVTHIIPRQARWTETWAFFVDETVKEVDITFQRKLFASCEYECTETPLEKHKIRVKVV